MLKIVDKNSQLILQISHLFIKFKKNILINPNHCNFNLEGVTPCILNTDNEVL